MRRKISIGLGAALAVVAAAAIWIAADPAPLWRYQTVSQEVVDRHGHLLRAFPAAGGYWRLRTTAAQVDPRYVALLTLIEDQRFAYHPGVDPLALARGLFQNLASTRVVSGASTLTMQTARLLDPQPRTIGAKLREIGRAIGLEARLTKSEILSIYLTLAPFGGNLEGVRAGALAWFGKEPTHLSLAEAALLVALPRNPEGLRPDRFPGRAKAARDAVIARAHAAGLISSAELAQATDTPVPLRRGNLPHLSAHLAERLANGTETAVIQTTIDADFQGRATNALKTHLIGFAPGVAGAALVIDHRTMETVVHLGGADYFDNMRAGMVDLTRSVRSPGSALKPFIYGMAFDELLLHPESLVEDRPHRFTAGYAPANFDQTYGGRLTARTALIRSRNVPAIAILEALGPLRFEVRLRDAGFPLRYDHQTARPSLPIGLGGVGVTLDELTRLYASLARGGEVVPTRETRGAGARATPAGAVLGARGAWYVMQILAEAPPPHGFATADGLPSLAFKTGTSYGYRDAWAVGVGDRHAIGVWIGRPDGAPCHECVGIEAAAPLLFRLAQIIGEAPSVLPEPPGILSITDLPEHLKLFTARDGGPRPDRATPRGALEIAYPIPQSRIPFEDEAVLPLRVEGGTPPYRWLINGAPVRQSRRGDQAEWRPDGPGFVAVAVVDADGAVAEAEVTLVSGR